MINISGTFIAACETGLAQARAIEIRYFSYNKDVPMWSACRTATGHQFPITTMESRSHAGSENKMISNNFRLTAPRTVNAVNLAPWTVNRLTVVHRQPWSERPQRAHANDAMSLAAHDSGDSNDIFGMLLHAKVWSSYMSAHPRRVFPYSPIVEVKRPGGA